jgi:excinuclease ABC subunit C
MIDRQKLISQIPHNPGIYKYFNKNNLLIYVGKAKDLKKRVASYFNKGATHNRKTKKLVSEITFIEFVVTNTEFDALLLENNLIKSNQPKYNILLKDDKSFPYICVSNHRFPRIYSLRNIDKTKGEFYGPYISVIKMRSVLDLVNKIYTLRTCKYNLSHQNIENKKYKICLEFHIGNCKGPCEDLQSEIDYNNNLKQAVNILKGNISAPRKFLEEKMQQYSSSLEFEKAEEYKIKLDQLNTFYNKSIVVNPRLGSLYVIALVSTENKAYISFMKVKNGSITQSQSLEVKKQLEEKNSKIVITSIPQLVPDLQNRSEITILSNINIDSPPEPIKIEAPKIGDKKKLVDMGVKNALFLKKNSEQKSTITNKTEKTLELLKDALSLPTIPFHIECFDNSNIQGNHPVASMVCFKNGKPYKKEYRKFKIKTVEGPDDFASMQEVVSRRYLRLQNEKKPLPNLVLIDGGKGQLSAAVEALKSTGVYGKVAIAGIAKRLEEIYLPGDSLPIHISKKSPALKLLQQLRDEAHRFAITFHRDSRSKDQVSSFLDNIEGIGNKTVELLLKTYKSPAKIKTVPISELSKLIGKHKGNLLIKHMKKASS